MTSGRSAEAVLPGAEVIQRAPEDRLILVILSARGDKDVAEVAAKVGLQMPA